ncbi:hypothetical protein [Lysinibacillus xylanilyticus]
MRESVASAADVWTPAERSKKKFSLKYEWLRQTFQTLKCYH